VGALQPKEVAIQQREHYLLGSKSRSTFFNRSF
jgi:hypothetical protein